MRFKVVIVALLSALMVQAGPALKRWRTVTMDDGTQQQVMLVGDEHRHYYVNKNSEVVKRQGDVFVKMNAENTLLSKDEAKSMMAKKMVLSSESMAKASAPARKVSRASYTGKKKGLIILVEFQDVKFTVDNANSVYQAIANEEGYQSNYGTTGSVHDYFKDQSYGVFDLEFDVIGPITLDNDYSYYGKNYTATYNNKEYDLDDLKVGQMVVEACKAVDSQVNFKDYDWDGDGEVDQVFVLYAGQGEASGGDEETVWPHESSLQACALYETLDSISNATKNTSTGSSSGRGGFGGFGGRGSSTLNENAIYSYFLNQFTLKLDGVSIDTYACSNELYKEGRRSYLMGIGTICHEFAHCLGFPDTYDTGDGSNFGMGYWDLMDGGSYNGPYGLGWNPAGFTSYERNFAGWLDYETLTDNEKVEAMPAISDEAIAYKITNPGNENEYFLIENRKQEGWDKYVPASGMLIIHVDYDKDIWDNNEVNASGSANAHQHMTILHADNSDKIREYVNEVIDDEKRDVFPYLKNDSVTDLSTPAFTLYNENTDGTFLLHARLMNITKNSDGTISFKYNPETEESEDETMDIKSVTGTADDPVVSIYDLKGIRVESAQLATGIYILRYQSGKVRKISIK